MPDFDKITSTPVFAAFVEEEKVSLAPEEHDAYEWLPFEEAKQRLVWSAQRNSLTHIHEHFVQQEPNPLFLLSSKTLNQLKRN